ncbi:MAG: homogentisate 1,2-dioxygenase [Calditrichia bacterium]
MPFYIKKGSIPSKRHIQHKSAEGKLRYEEHISREGFSDIYSNVYHLFPPTRVKKIDKFIPVELQPTKDQTYRHHHLETFKLDPYGDWVFGRQYLAFNNDLVMATTSPVKNTDFFYKNGIADEILFVHQGQGTLESMFGKLNFSAGDYIVIPRSVIYTMTFESENNRLLVIESRGAVRTPKRYRNNHGQLLEHAPFCERDFKVPEFTDPLSREGEFKIFLRLESGIQPFDLAHHPFDLVGWDGYYYPWIFNINDFMPITGKVHQPPPVHQTFEADGYVICSFVPRLYDYHDQAIPAPYAHSNVESDEIFYYVSGNFMSRRGISKGSITLHPMGLPHGPHPGRYEESIGKKETKELAVMVDTFRPLQLTNTAMQVDDDKYPFSWLSEDFK